VGMRHVCVVCGQLFVPEHETRSLRRRAAKNLCSARCYSIFKSVAKEITSTLDCGCKTTPAAIDVLINAWFRRALNDYQKKHRRVKRGVIRGDGPSP
jgi:hypothetical protein